MRTLSTTHTTRHVEVKWRKGKSCFSRNTDEQGIPEEAEKQNLLIITSDTQIQSDNASDLSKGLSLNIVIKQLLQSYFREFNSVMLHILTSFSF